MPRPFKPRPRLRRRRRVDVRAQAMPLYYAACLTVILIQQFTSTAQHAFLDDGPKPQMPVKLPARRGV